MMRALCLQEGRWAEALGDIDLLTCPPETPFKHAIAQMVEHSKHRWLSIRDLNALQPDVICFSLHLCCFLTAAALRTHRCGTPAQPTPPQSPITHPQHTHTHHTRNLPCAGCTLWMRVAKRLAC
jgi:hypothetical protein